ncbi:hypothetical protein SAMN04488121_109234 [Chitinophaga filiformis]|uniref:Uncharacterized protein n=1 Tax=Chitinophaga filiformis TaxID=104663 RepID=A0A1G8AH83_CHIFI|nr:hypothetical protein SAMN04488121_109234 [Chitinophaga filiformis]
MNLEKLRSNKKGRENVKCPKKLDTFRAFFMDKRIKYSLKVLPA